MSNTIALLETIGGSAALRYASAARLIGALEQADASSALKGAVSSGNGSLLLKDFDEKALQVAQFAPQVVQLMWREEGFSAE